MNVRGPSIPPLPILSQAQPSSSHSLALHPSELSPHFPRGGHRKGELHLPGALTHLAKSPFPRPSPPALQPLAGLGTLLMDTPTAKSRIAGLETSSSIGQ